jgi:hypothetical protein
METGEKKCLDVSCGKGKIDVSCGKGKIRT